MSPTTQLPRLEISARKTWHWNWILITAILCLALVLYLYKIDAKSLWMDELISVADVKDGRGLPPQNLVRPLYYILLSFWMKIGGIMALDGNDAWLRSLAVPFGLGSVFLTYLLGRRLFGESEGLIAALLLALSPIAIRHAQEVRMYSLGMCLGVGGTLALAYALEKPKATSINWWAGLRFLAMLTTPLHASLLVSDLVIIGLKFRKQTRVLFAFGLRFLIIGLLWMPSVFASATKSTTFSGEGHVTSRMPPTLADAVRQIGAFTFWPFRGIEINPKIMAFYKAFTALSAGFLAAAFLNKAHLEKVLWVAAWALLPLAQFFVFSHVSFSLWLNRYLVGACPYVLLLLAIGFMQIWRRWRSVGGLIVLAYLLAVMGGLTVYYNPAIHNDSRARDYRGIVETINRNEKPGDAIVWAVRSSRPLISLDHYYRGSAPVNVKGGVPSSVDVELSDIENWLSEIPQIESRLWLVCWLNTNNAPLLKTALEERFELQIHRVFPTFKGQSTLEVFLTSPSSAAVEVVASAPESTFTRNAHLRDAHS